MKILRQISRITQLDSEDLILSVSRIQGVYKYKQLLPRSIESMELLLWYRTYESERAR